MKKRILAIISCIIILSVFTLSTFAYEYSDPETIGLSPMVKGPEYSVGPTADFTSRYKLVVNPFDTTNQFRGYTDYDIIDLMQSGVAVIPQEQLQKIGFIQHFIPEYTDGSITNSYRILLADGTGLTISVEGVYIYAYLTIYNAQGVHIKSTVIFDAMLQDNDVAFYIDYDGALNIMVYNKTNGNVVSSNIFNIQLYGIVYPQDVFPFSTAMDVETAEQRGYTKGYNNGVTVGSQIKQDRLDQEYQSGYDDGEEKGYISGKRDGYEEAIAEFPDVQAIYDRGVAYGQSIKASLESMFDDFFGGVVNFMSFFMSMGVGGITIFTLCSVVVFAFVIMLIVKIIRG